MRKASLTIILYSLFCAKCTKCSLYHPKSAKILGYSQFHISLGLPLYLQFNIWIFPARLFVFTLFFQRILDNFLFLFHFIIIIVIVSSSVLLLLPPRV